MPFCLGHQPAQQKDNSNIMNAQNDKELSKCHSEAYRYFVEARSNGPCVVSDISFDQNWRRVNESRIIDGIDDWIKDADIEDYSTSAEYQYLTYPIAQIVRWTLHHLDKNLNLQTRIVQVKIVVDSVHTQQKEFGVIGEKISDIYPSIANLNE